MQGQASEEKVGINERNIQQGNIKIAEQNESHEAFQIKVGLRWLEGLKEHMPNKTAIQIMGADGLELQEVLRTEAQTEFDILVEDKAQKDIEDRMETEKKMSILSHPLIAQSANPKKVMEELLKMSYDNSDVREFLDQENFINRESINNASADFQEILENKMPEVRNNTDQMYCKQFNTLMIETDINDRKKAMAQEHLDKCIEKAKINAFQQGVEKVQQTQQQGLEKSLEQGIPQEMTPPQGQSTPPPNQVIGAPTEAPNNMAQEMIQ